MSLTPENDFNRLESSSTHDPPETTLGERLHSVFVRQLGLRNRDFSHERVAWAMAALNAARAPLAPMTELDPDRATNSIGRISIELRLWRARHRRSHPGLQERRQILLSRIADIGSKDRLITEATLASAAPGNHAIGADAALGG